MNVNSVLWRFVFVCMRDVCVMTEGAWSEAACHQKDECHVCHYACGSKSKSKQTNIKESFHKKKKKKIFEELFLSIL